jgi:hypothetical protein
VSKKGYAPYNPRKRNQDALTMEEHRPTGTLLFGVFDGHGEVRGAAAVPDGGAGATRDRRGGRCCASDVAAAAVSLVIDA